MLCTNKDTECTYTDMLRDVILKFKILMSLTFEEHD